MKNLDVVVRKPDFNEFVISGEIHHFLIKKLAEQIVKSRSNKDKSYKITDDAWYNHLKKWSTSYHGIDVVPRGALLSGQDMLQHTIDLNDVSSLLAAVVVVKSGAASDVNIKIQDANPLFKDFTTFDFANSDLEAVGIKIIYDVILDVYNDFEFTFKVGPNNSQPVKQLSDASRIFRAELNRRFKKYSIGLDLLESAAKLARVYFSMDDAVVNFIQDYDLDVVKDNSPLTQWMLNTNVAILGNRKKLGEVYDDSFQAKFVKNVKRLKDYQSHQNLMVEVLNKIYNKFSASQMRQFFVADIETIRREGTLLEGEETYVLTPMNAIQFIELKLKSSTDERIHGYSVYDQISGTDLKMYGSTNDDLEDMVTLFHKTMDQRINEYQPVRYRALEALHLSEEFRFDYKVTNFFSNETLAAIFSEVEEVNGEIRFVFESKFILPNEQVKEIAGENTNVYITQNAEMVAKYVDYEKYCSGARSMEVKLTSTMPTPSRDYNIKDGVYTNATFRDILDYDLKYFDKYKRLLRKPSMQLRSLTKFDDIKPDGKNLKTLGDLFRHLELIHDPDTELYALLDGTKYYQFDRKRETFFDFLNKKELSHRLTYTNYVNRVVEPIRKWLVKNAGYNVLSMKVLSAPVRQSDEYRLACFYLMNEILALYGLEFSKKEMEFVEPASLNTQIGVI